MIRNIKLKGKDIEVCSVKKTKTNKVVDHVDHSRLKNILYSFLYFKQQFETDFLKIKIKLEELKKYSNKVSKI